MIGTVRKHQSWLWAIIIVVTIISFLYWSPNVSTNVGSDGRGGYDLGSINGKKITQEDFAKAANEVRILAFFSNGKWVDRSELERPEWTREVYNRLVLFEKMKDLNVRPTDAATAQWIKNLLTRGSNQDVAFDQFERIIKNNFEPQGISLEQFEQFARHELGREHLQSVYGLAGALVTPTEATDIYRSENDEYHTELAVFSSSNFLSQVKVTDAEIGKFYTNYMAQYDLPPRIQVSYVHFDVSNYLAEADQEMTKATNLNQYLDQQYYTRTNEFKGVSRDEALKQLREDVRKQFALGAARKSAADFIQDLYKGHDDNNPLSPQDLGKVAAAKNIPVKETPLFDRNATTNEVGLPAEALQSASRLSNNDPEDKGRERLYTMTPVMGPKGAYVLGLKQRVDRQVQPLTAVKSKVVEDYKRLEAAKLARDAGTAFGTFATNQIAKGKTFSSAADEKKIKPVKVPAFSINSRTVEGLNESIDPRQVKVVAMKLKPGQASDFVATQDGGFVLFLASRSPADPTKMQTELPKFTEQIREQRQYAAFNEWFQKQWQDLKVVATLLEQKNQQQKPKS